MKIRDWFKVAYPKVLQYRQDDNETYLSSDKKTVEGVITEDGAFVFLVFCEDTEREVSDPYQIVLGCLMTWGPPKIQYRFRPEPGLKPRPVKEIPEPSKSVTLESGQVSDRESALKFFRGHFDVSVKTRSGGSVVLEVSGKPGPVLYEYGICPSEDTGHLFTPWSHKSDVERIINDYIKKL